jgi:hypothetical protein
MNRRFCQVLALLASPLWAGAAGTPSPSPAPNAISAGTPSAKAPTVGFKFQPPSQPAKGQHVGTGTIVAFADGFRALTLDHRAFQDGFLQARRSTFTLKDPSLAAKFKPGDRVQFTLQASGGSPKIVAIQPSDR